MFTEIPYSHASGRDLAAVNARYQSFQAAKARAASSEELQNICGPMRLQSTENICTTKVGRPSNQETASCDVYCCLAGHKTGNCASKAGIQVNENVVAGILASGGVTTAGILAAIPGLVKLSASCRCLDEDLDVKCGLDGSFMGIRCPDQSACWRKCCRQGRNDGKCGGFLKLKCKCS